jgi:hypothetical protein
MNVERLRDLYPSLTEPELKEAKENLERYFAVAWKIAHGSQADFDNNGPLPSMEERSLSNLKNIPFDHG